MIIRPYQPEDDDALMALERQSARGFPKPFVHFRRRFMDRAELYADYCTLVAIDGDQLVGVSSVGLKYAMLEGEYVKVGYSFDSRVAPSYRGQGLGFAMLTEKLAWAKNKGAVGVYSLIVATNKASLGMVEKAGYQKSRMILYLQFQPSPLITPFDDLPNCTDTPEDHVLIQSAYQYHDLYMPDMGDQLRGLEFQRWKLCEGQHSVGLSVYNQGRIFMKIPAEAPWPRTERDIQRLGRTWQLFDVVGLEHPKLLAQLFEQVRDEAVMSDVNKLVWVLDRTEKIPRFVMDDSSYQTDYWLMFRNFTDYSFQWKELVYLDPRDL